MDPSTIALVVGGPIARADVDACIDQLAGLRATRKCRLVVCDVEALVRPDVTTVDALARLALAQRRAGRSVLLLRATPELRELLVLADLCEVLPCAPGSVVETRGQPEHREELLRVQEERDPADPIP
jgi:ABC-type transporter Mla MlaB component